MSIWDNPELKSADDYVSFVEIGDQVVGTITAITTHTWPAEGDKPARVVPKLFIMKDDGNEVGLTASQAMLMSKLARLRPEIGDRLAVVLTDIEKRSGNRTLKHFDVQVARAAVAANPAAAAALAATPAPAPQPAAVPAAAVV